MIKQFWVIRSREKLFWGLTAAIVFVLTLYTLLTFGVLPEQIPFRHLPWGAAAQASRLWLLLLPLFSLLLIGLLFLVRWRELTPPPFKGRGLSPEVAQKRRSAYLERLVYAAFPLTMLLFFWQIDRLNTAKELAGFSPMIPLAFLAAFLIYSTISAVRICRIR